MDVSGGLDTEDLKQDVSIRGGSDNLFRLRCSGKGSGGSRRRSWNGE
jgi:hypothetical protein